MTPTELARHLEYTLLRADATEADIRALCAEARQLEVYAVCVPGSRVTLARHLLNESPVQVVTVAGFPLGNQEADVKRYEVEAAIDSGAHEVDVVLNIGRLKEGDEAYVRRELRDLVEAADERPVKIILETCLLSRDEIRTACRLAVEAEARYVKTSTGLGPSGATVADVQLLRACVGPKFGVKAAGGIRDVDAALSMIGAGANRIGTSSARAILHGLEHPPVL